MESLADSVAATRCSGLAFKYPRTVRPRFVFRGAPWYTHLLHLAFEIYCVCNINVRHERRPISTVFCWYMSSMYCSCSKQVEPVSCQHDETTHFAPTLPRASQTQSVDQPLGDLLCFIDGTHKKCHQCIGAFRFWLCMRLALLGVDKRFKDPLSLDRTMCLLMGLGPKVGKQCGC